MRSMSTGEMSSYCIRQELLGPALPLGPDPSRMLREPVLALGNFLLRMMKIIVFPFKGQ